jgi:formylglycine-generating enzyme required for sulfatase activity
MVAVADLFCMDRYEASRPNATDTWQGDDNSTASSRENVLPWFPVTKATAAAACAAAGKRLCAPEEFLAGCQGPGGSVYPYGDTYLPLLCNGIDTYCSCGLGSVCEGISPCPYPHCFNSPPAGESVPASGCGSAMHVTPTGAFPQCVSAYGAWDISGNVWELVDDGTPEGEFRGGAYNCIDSETLHRCDYATTNILAKGFRCCK